MGKKIINLFILLFLPLYLWAAEGSFKVINKTDTMSFSFKFKETHSEKERGWFKKMAPGESRVVSTNRTLSAPDVKDFWVRAYNKNGDYLGAFLFSKNINIKNNDTTKVELNWSLKDNKVLRKVYKPGKNELDYSDSGDRIWEDDRLLDNILVASMIAGDSAKKILKFEYNTIVKILECLKGREKKVDRKKVLNYQHAKKQFEPNKCLFFGDCSWWASEVLNGTFPNLYRQMLKLKEPNQTAIRAYVWYHIFNELLKIQGETPLSPPNAWVRKVLPEKLENVLKANNLLPKVIKNALNSYKQRHNFFEQMEIKDWKKTLESIKDNWKIIKKVEDWNPGDFLVAYYYYDKSKVEMGGTGSTGHSMMIVGYPKKVSPFIYEVAISDSGNGPRIDEVVRKKMDSGIGLGKIRVLVNPITGMPKGWQTKKSTTAWRDTKGRILVGRVLKDLNFVPKEPKLITPPADFEEGDFQESVEEEVDVQVLIKS